MIFSFGPVFCIIIGTIINGVLDLSEHYHIKSPKTF